MNTDPKEFLFQTKEFAISEHSFHFLRNRFNYKTINATEVRDLILEKGHQVANWLIILVIGTCLLALSGYYFLRLFDYLGSDSSSGPIFIESFVIPVIPMLLGAYCLYISLKTGARLRVTYGDNKSKHFPLVNVQKEGQIDSLVQVLEESSSFSTIFKNGL
ncbi:hypothetical protein BFP97_17400 [Roseivirga sp. 4D4]|uniref:hypothetical protein n=1 Tax=Roseivirga sp. 4D4 TaxID=1889784 RepID=UPI0008534DD8|nr:hypothetical protein [Roseivirga sp. 4D4]OEK03188.1 hypothetical protein BFP97_17400 [Roseivirga sp. 4D4]